MIPTRTIAFLAVCATLIWPGPLGGQEDVINLAVLKGPRISVYEREYESVLQVIGHRVYGVFKESDYVGRLYSTPAELSTAIDEAKDDIIILDPYTYLSKDFPREKLNLIGGSVDVKKQLVELVLVEPITPVTDPEIAKQTRVFSSHHAHSIAKLWIRQREQKTGNRPFEELFPDVQFETKSSAALLGLFFGKCGRCIVPAHTFETHSKLNPQIQKRLKIVDRSFAFPNGLIATVKASLIDVEIVKNVLFSLGDSRDGRQLIETWATGPGSAIRAMEDKDLKPLRDAMKALAKLEGEK